MTALVLVGLLAIAIGGLACLREGRLTIGFVAQAAGALALGAAGLWALVSGDSWGSSFTSDFTPHAGIDGLTGVFLLTLALVACPALVFASSYVARTTSGRITGVLSAAFLLSLIGVLCARDALSFLFFWELMTLVPAAIILAGTATESARRTVFTYVAITHLGGAGTWIALLLLAHEGAIGDSTALTEGSSVQAVIAISAIIGFGTKAGLMPMHAWLPRAHPIAPAPVSALMSAVMVAVAAYGLIRVLVDWLGPAPSWVGATVLVLGGLSALGGIVYALFQRDLKRLLAYSTVEHLGIVALGLGASLLLRRHGADAWAAFALGAALLHAINHAVFKALLFLGAGAFERATGGLELDRLGGLLRRMPWSGGAFLVGCLAIAGMPLLNGFASEWLTLQALLHVPAYAGVWDGTLGAVALAALAGTMALAVLCFVKVIGLVLLGPARRTGVADALESASRDARRARHSRRSVRRARSRAGIALPAARRPRSLARDRSRPDSAGPRPPRHRQSSDGRPACGRRWPGSAPVARSRQPPGRAEPELGLWPARRVAPPLDERGVQQATAARAGSGAPPAARDRDDDARRRRTARLVRGSGSPPDRCPPLPPGHGEGAAHSLLGTSPAERSTRHLRRLPDRAWSSCCSSPCGSGQSDDGAVGHRRPGASRRRHCPLPAAHRRHAAGQGASPGKARVRPAPAIPRAPPPVGKERRRRRGHDARLPPGPCHRGGGHGRGDPPRPDRGRRASARCRPGRARAGRPARALATGGLRGGVGHVERLRTSGREPRSDAVRVRGSGARPLPRGRGAGRRHDRPRRSDRGDGRRAPLDDAGTRPRCRRLRARRRRRDRPPARRQPGHAPRADDDPRGAGARVRRTRPGLPPVGAGGSALARAGTRGPGLPPPPREHMVATGSAARLARAPLCSLLRSRRP